MLSTNNRNSSSTGTPRNENATQKLVRENVDFLIEQLKAGRSDALTAYLTAMILRGRKGCEVWSFLAALRKLPSWARTTAYTWISGAILANMTHLPFQYLSGEWDAPWGDMGARHFAIPQRMQTERGKLHDVNR